MTRVPPNSLAALRRYAVARSLFAPTSLARAVRRLGFVQADPIRAPARAQDLTLRPRVVGYRAGDLDRRYAALGVEEDTFVNYGFVTRQVQALMHPRVPASHWSATTRRRAAALLRFVAQRGEVHPREVDDHFDHGTVTNAWGGSSSATTHLLDGMHYRGLLRVVRRDDGVRVYAVRQPLQCPLAADEALDALVDVVVGKYAPLPASSLTNLVSRLRWAAPQFAHARRDALARAKRRLQSVCVEGGDWFWPASERVGEGPGDEVRLLGPFDPVVWDRRRFELLWGWAYRFEAYTPKPRRRFGYYALPLLWRDEVIGWGNVSARDQGELEVDLGFVSGKPPRGPVFRRELDAELERMRAFLSPASPRAE